MTLVAPSSLAAALAVLADHPEAMILAGGTDTMVAVNSGRLRPTVIVSLHRVPELRHSELSDDSVRIGAGVTYAQLEGEPYAPLLPALAQAARTVGSPQSAIPTPRCRTSGRPATC